MVHTQPRLAATVSGGPSQHREADATVWTLNAAQRPMCQRLSSCVAVLGGGAAISGWA